MRILEGKQTIKIKDTDYEKFVEHCLMATNAGYKLIQASKKRLWPRFWIVKYKATLSKDVILAGGEIIEVDIDDCMPSSNII